MIRPPLFVPDTPLPSPITEFALQVTSNLADRDDYASGTAVIVSPILAFAARHVLDEHWRRHEGREMPWGGEFASRFSLVLFQRLETHTNAWAVTKLWTSSISDIALIRLTPYSSETPTYRFQHITVDLAPPRIGERVSAFGYYENKVVVRGKDQLEFHMRAGTTHGDVVEIHHERRDRGMLSFPCFRMNAQVEHGMSGGPVFNESGLLCGLLCAGLPPSAPGEPFVSYAMSLWPAMAIPISLDRQGHPAGERYLAFDLVKERMIVAKNADRIVIGPLDETGTAAIGFRR